MTKFWTSTRSVIVILAMSFISAPPFANAEDLPAALRVGDSFVYDRQVWTPQAGDTTVDTYGRALRLDVQSVELRLDAIGTRHPTVAIGLTSLQWAFDGEAFRPGDTRRSITLLIDADSGKVFGVRPYEGVLSLGTPATPPEFSAFLPDGEMPCALTYLASRLAGSNDPTGGSCYVFGVKTDPNAEWRTDNAVSRQTPEERREIAAWVTDGPVLSQIANTLPFGPDPDDALHSVDYLASWTHGTGPIIGESLVSLPANGEIAMPAFAEYSATGPTEGTAPFGFTWTEARAAIDRSASGGLLAIYLQTHRDAVVTTLEYQETPEQDLLARSWLAVWSDGQGEGHAVRATERTLSGSGSALPIIVESVGAEEYSPFVHRFGRSGLPANSMSLESAIDLSVAHAPPAAPLSPTAIRWVTYSTLADGTRTNTPAGAAGTFAGWEVQVGGLEYVARPITESSPSRMLWVALDATTGRALFVATESSGMDLHPLVGSGDGPRFASAAETFGTESPGARFSTPPSLIVAASGLALLTVLASSAVGREQLTRILVLPLCARIHGDRTLVHKLRRRTHHLIATKPGIGTQSLSRELGTPEGTVRYHVNVLVSRGFVREQHLDGLTGYTLTTVNTSEAAAKMAARHPHAGSIAALIGTTPSGVTLREVMQETGIAQGAAYHHLMRLASRGVIRVERSGRTLRYFPLPSLAAT